MAITRNHANVFKKSTAVTTLIDAVVELTRGRRRTGLLLLGAALLSLRATGVGMLASILLRVYRRLR
ncbi:hypothetical protein OB919_16205 [Halobacteria archaeon AArc-curdl1]|uniref:Uncharacterized protein n=1 Tax=Natronosalvus hydrolyticus TaxID=2979988 RepID=A0AAP3E753_9EURY|nr:hypothetical protein [Halobacteria archaeon AArc-curdl1]